MINNSECFHFRLSEDRVTVRVYHLSHQFLTKQRCSTEDLIVYLGRKDYLQGNRDIAHLSLQDSGGSDGFVGTLSMHTIAFPALPVRSSV